MIFYRSEREAEPVGPSSIPSSDARGRHLGRLCKDSPDYIVYLTAGKCEHASKFSTTRVFEGEHLPPDHAQECAALIRYRPLLSARIDLFLSD